MTTSPYNRLSAAEKREVALDTQRERPISCPVCDVTVTVDQLPAHLATRCEGPREPDSMARWVTFTETLAFGVPSSTLAWWIHRHRVRQKVGWRDGRRRRVYLLRDVVHLLAHVAYSKVWSKERPKNRPARRARLTPASDGDPR